VVVIGHGEHTRGVTDELVAVVLAAGGGTRFAGPTHKLLADLDGVPVVVRSVQAVCAAGLGPVVVVTGAVALDDVLADAGLLEQVRVVENPRWSEGQAGSLRTGLAEAERLGAAAVVVGLGDQPMVSEEAWRRVGHEDSDRPIAVATYDGRRRNPVRLHRSVWGELREDGDEGARELMRRRPELVVEVPCPGEPADIDTLEDLSRWS
jgi:CTP:molybdopterin cytidylyltransferase MocA